MTIPAGVLPSDVLVSSPIIGGGGGGGGGGAGMPGSPGGAAAGGGGGGDAFAEYGGVDPNMDPELAMALRVSMEEERARQERAAAAAAEAGAAEGGAEESKDGEEAEQEGMEVDADGKPAAEASAPAAAAAPDAAVMGGAEDEDALLQQALAMSMAESYAPPAGAEEGATKNEDDDGAKPSAAAAAAEAAPMEMDEDAEMAMALAMSMQQDGGGEGGGAEFQDPAFVNQVRSWQARSGVIYCVSVSYYYIIVCSLISLPSVLHLSPLLNSFLDRSPVLTPTTLTSRMPSRTPRRMAMTTRRRTVKANRAVELSACISPWSFMACVILN